MPSFAPISAARTASSMVSRSTPGIEGTDSRRFSPSMMKIGQIRSLVVSTVSRTIRRAHSVRRLRRGRWDRSRRAACGSAKGLKGEVMDTGSSWLSRSSMAGLGAERLSGGFVVAH